MKIYSSAKINLNLIIDNNVVNGLHTLSTLMIPVNLFDEIEIREIDTDDDIIEFTPQIQMNGESTIHKALQCLRSGNNFEQKFHIKVKKNIPIEAGLGGGSSNAGSIIKYMATRYSLNIPEQAVIASSIGSDVPFFVNGSTAQVTGFGEKIKSIKLTEPMHLLIASPHETLSTVDVFNSFDEQAVEEEVETKFYKNIEIKNNLWNAAVRIEPKLLEHKRYLESIVESEFFMSGSGTTLFCFGEENELTDKKEKINIEHFRHLAVTKKIDCSLLQEAD
ncbi:hypothetical protein N9C54_00920 [Acidimicrobiia bacterium]|nr:hypothetical protein [Candidatus Actinomarina sp.]MDA8922953.1 hypothetical protein [Acidimicrobiia bacterium]MDA8812667.1 hypothetical protein [Candidatus Actinomarina sp.]MDA9173433.1 hypothetical protein [Acidimicrobiia bacterium]MDA9844477.1 hypothetical protein [Acidimicrobiia bacterium]